MQALAYATCHNPKTDKTMNKAYYDTRPAPIEAVGDGSHRYRWAIEKATMPGTPDGQQDTMQWTCYEVTVWGRLDPDTILRAAIAARWGTDAEAKLLNDFNAAQIGLFGSAKSAEAAKYIDRYKEFLGQRKALKEQIENDWREYGQ